MAAPHPAEPVTIPSSALEEKPTPGIRLPGSPPVVLLRHRRAIIVLLHFALIPLGYAVAFLLRFETDIPAGYVQVFWTTVPLLILIRLATFAAFRLFNGWWRYAGMYDLMALVKATTVSSALFVAILFVTNEIHGYPRSVVLLDWGIAIFMFGGIRFGVRWVREGRLRRTTFLKRKRTLIVGAGDAAAHLLRQVRIDPSCAIDPVGLVDDDRHKRWSQLDGVSVLGTTRELKALITKHRVALVVVAIAGATSEKMREIAEQCAGLSVELRVLPSLRELIEGKVKPGELRTVNLEDLLGRPSVNLDLERVRRDLQGRIVLITGAAGSIGSELSRQIATFGPSRLVLVEQAESPLFFVDFELTWAHPDLEIIPVIADIRDTHRLEEIFSRYRPNYVFHAAAYKHVPLMETNISEAVSNNILATFEVANCATRYGVEKFVLISTDKAVRPASIMGASKRVAERTVLEWPEFRSSRTDFRAVRFGNVLGSTGSVIPLFKRQISMGGPVTVTHPEMRRYFMTIPEAVQLVLQAAAVPEAARRVSMLDMGEPVRILEMAENLIRLSGFEPYTEMPIVITGIRPGEKILEELVAEVEHTVPTQVEKVRIVDSAETDGADIQSGLVKLAEALGRGDNDAVIDVMCRLVPDSIPPLADKGVEAAARLTRRQAWDQMAQEATDRKSLRLGWTTA